MKKLKFYALCSTNIKATKRHLRTIPKEDLHIVLNSLNTDYLADAEAYCQSENIDYTITSSDGTPSTGKNSVLEIFEASDNDYMVLIDGDDFITPHGVWTYHQLTQSDTCPDVVALEYQYGIYADRGYTSLSLTNPLVGCSDLNDHDQIRGYGCRCFFQPASYWEAALAGKLIRIIPGNQHSVDLNDVHRRWATYAWTYINNMESHCRVVFYSKKAAAFKFDTDLLIGEDTLQYFRLKHEHMEGRLVMKGLVDRYPTYVYDTRINGISSSEERGPGWGNWLEWLEKLTIKYEEYDAAGMMHIQKIPIVDIFYPGMIVEDQSQTWDITWPNNYIPDVMNLVAFNTREQIWWEAAQSAPIGGTKLFHMDKTDLHAIPRA